MTGCIEISQTLLPFSDRITDIEYCVQGSQDFPSPHVAVTIKDVEHPYPDPTEDIRMGHRKGMTDEMSRLTELVRLSYRAFVNYLTYEHMHMRRNIAIRWLKRNSVGTSIKQLRIFLRDRMRRKIIPAIDLSDFKILDEETDAIYLSVEEIRTLYNINLSEHPEWARFRDLFVLGSFTGLRFSDFNGIKPEDIRNGMLYKKQGKSDHWVVIPLRSEAHDILMNRFKRKVPQTSNAELNRYIKILRGTCIEFARIAEVRQLIAENTPHLEHIDTVIGNLQKLQALESKIKKQLGLIELARRTILKTG